MAVGPESTAHVIVPGVRLASVACGIKAGRDDLVLLEFAEGSQSAGVFTQSLFAAAPVVLGKRHLALAAPRYFVINAGNANAGVGEVGVEDALSCCRALAAAGKVAVEQVLPFSTGVIGERLPAQKIIAGLDKALLTLSEDHWLAAAGGIMTTDTRRKITSREARIGTVDVSITGIAKGAGMIQPDMATMLSYVASDVKASQATLQACLAEAVNCSFNRITVDSDTSTNDSLMLTATGVSGLNIDDDPDARQAFQVMLNAVCVELAQAIIRDGEGATKFVAVKVVNGAASDDCLAIAYAIANSPLIKTALYASDANWGRIVMAIGKAGVALDVNRLDIFLGDVLLMQAGEKHPGYQEDAGAAVMAEEEITITVDLNAGDAAETVWTSDLSHEYVRINAEYRT